MLFMAERRKVMFPNLEAEQARNGHTNEYVAEILGLSRQAYEIKKKTGKFKLVEIKRLTQIYNASFDYLFETKNMALGGASQQTAAV
jgi:inorganic pyrophosphatase